jgi:hypothetical protein
MKKIALVVTFIFGLMFSHFAMAYDFDMAKLKINFTGPVNNKAYFLCVSNNGCSRISAAAQGKIYSMDVGNVSYIFAASMANLKMRSQVLPSSCKVKVSKDQTLTVSGKLIVKDNTPYIGNLKCSVT